MSQKLTDAEKMRIEKDVHKLIMNLPSPNTVKYVKAIEYIDKLLTHRWLSFRKMTGTLSPK